MSTYNGYGAGKGGWKPASGRPPRKNNPAKENGSRPRGARQEDLQIPHAYELNGDSGPSERFNTRKGKYRKEADRMNSLTTRFKQMEVDDMDSRSGQGMGGALIVRNELVSKYENESTDYAREDWRRMPLIPTAEELSQDSVDVPCNVIDDSYDSVEEYLSTHYELLREDAVAGLRDAIAYIRLDPDSDDTQKIAVYENVSEHWFIYYFR